jgi:hypothetical protein
MRTETVLAENIEPTRELLRENPGRLSHAALTGALIAWREPPG